MILVDTSVWIDHLRAGEPRLAQLLDVGEIVMHPWVVGELALGRLDRRHEILTLVSELPQAPVATPEEVLSFIEAWELPGVGIGYVDAHLLASTLLLRDGVLWTRDRRLAAAASGLGRAMASPTT